ncbi:MAG TPA: hypothetical protein VFU21_15035 [Kofleriaceae bacterium]|nr:hypothetical protein [Kofleriaceae bacterium]
MPSKKAVLGWVLVSYFLIAGGVALAAVSLALFAVASRAASDAVFFLGALVGGLVAGRASRHKAVAEPAVAALLVVGTMMAIFSVGVGRSFPWSSGDGILPLPVQLGLVAGLGGLVGGLIGRRSRSGRPEGSAWRWWGVAMLVNLGATFMLVSSSMVWLGGVGEDAEVGAIFLGLAVAWLLGGFCAQAIMPRRMIWVSGAGSFAIVLLAGAFSTVRGDVDAGAVIGAGFLWGVGTLIGALGALIGWRLIASRVAAAPATELPEVRLHS